MDVIEVPYHLDEYLAELDFPLRAREVVTAELPPGNTWDRLAVLYAKVADAVASHGNGLVVVGSGDCTTALGTVAGLQRAGRSPGIIWLDAHGDVQTPETTSSGYLGGMPLRLLTGYRPELIAAALGLKPVPEHRMLLVGARDLDPPEETYLAQSSIRRCEVSELDPGALPEGPLYVHLDLDVADPAEVPGLRYPTPSGPSLGAVAAAMGLLIGTGQVAAIGLACTWHPGHDAARGPGKSLLAEALRGRPPGDIVTLSKITTLWRWTVTSDPIEPRILGTGARTIGFGSGAPKATISSDAPSFIRWVTQRGSWPELDVRAAGDEAALSAARRLGVALLARSGADAVQFLQVILGEPQRGTGHVFPQMRDR